EDRSDRLRRDERRGRSARDERVQCPARREMVEGVHRRGRVPEQQRTLPEIVEQQARERHAEPRDLDGAMTEVAEVRIQRLAAGHYQEDRTQDDETPSGVVGE